jgi:hypothetical protein
MSWTQSRRLFVCIMLVVAAVSILPSLCRAEDARELYRIRLINRPNGAIEVSDDGGHTYSRIGKVLRPATSTQRGFAASVFSEPGKVVATAVHGIRIKTGGARECDKDASQTVSIIPLEFAHTPTGFGGYVAGPSGIYTDIPTGDAIFRNLAPFVGNHVYREVGSQLGDIYDGYMPRDGDVLIIIATIPARYPKEMLVENKAGGSVSLVYADGEEKVARVERPVRGIGRFDATGYTGVGRINTNHTGVLTISTAPITDGAKDGSSHETRGGFMIQPSRHAKTNSETNQILVVGPLSDGGQWLEGMAPIFAGYIGLAYDPKDEQHSFRVDIKTDKSDWIPMPEMLGWHDDALVHLPNGKGALTDIRLHFPDLSADWVHSQIALSSRQYMAKGRAHAVKNGVPIISDDSLTLKVDASKLDGLNFVNLYVDGEFRGSSNTAPFSFTLDTRSLPRGEHVAVIRAIATTGTIMKESTQSFFVQDAGVSSAPR